MAESGSLSRLLRARRRVRTSSGARPPQDVEQPPASMIKSGVDAKRSSLELSNDKKPGKYSAISYFWGVLVMIALALLANTIMITASNSRDERYGSPSLRSQYNFQRSLPRTITISQIEPMTLTDVPYTKDFEHDSVIPSNSTLIEPNLPELVKGYDKNVCKPTHDWQTKSFPNCNMFHETSLSEMTFITSGTLRSVFELSENIDGHFNKFVYKNLDYNGKHNVDLKRIDQERKDALILERSTSSKFIPGIHGYCSTAVMMDHAPEDMETYNEQRLDEDIIVSPLDRLKISIHIASSVADLHSVDFIHNDLHEQQFLFQDGLFKLNDFNYAKPMYANKNTNETCTLSEKFNMGLFGRSLEELQYKIDYEGFTPVIPDKIDVWMMGNLLYTILTDLQVWDEELRSDEDVKMKQAESLVAGNRPRIPKRISESNDPLHVAMLHALNMTWTYNWKERPSARAVANYLIGELRNITGEEEPDLRINFLNEGFR